MDDKRERKSLQPKRKSDKPRKPKKVHSPKISIKRTTYFNLTSGGRVFIPLTTKNFERLTDEEQKNIARAALYTGEDIRLMTEEDYKEINKIPEISSKVMQRYLDIASGKVDAELADITITNYKKGLIEAGYASLADRFEKIAKLLKDKDRNEFDVFMTTEMPNLYLYYKDKGKSHTKRQPTYVQETADEAIESIEEVLANKFAELDESDKAKIERELYPEEYEDSAEE